MRGHLKFSRGERGRRLQSRGAKKRGRAPRSIALSRKEGRMMKRTILLVAVGVAVLALVVGAALATPSSGVCPRPH